MLVAVILAAFIGIFRTPLADTATEIACVLVSGNMKMHPIYAVDLPEKKIAISFDAAWGCTRTQPILQILQKHHIRTTFFLTNIWVDKYPQYAKDIVAAGHEAALHSASHPNFTELSNEKIQEELFENEKLITSVTGQKPYLFRPPFGAYNNRVIKTVQEANFVPIQWSIDSLDWKNLSAEQIFQRVTSKLQPGAIVLFHNDGTNTPQALEPIIEFAEKEGYSIIPVSELIYKDNYYIDVNGIQKLRE